MPKKNLKEKLKKSNNTVIQSEVVVATETTSEVKVEVVEPQKDVNRYITVIELNGRKCNRIYNPLDGTTHEEIIE